ncbi:NUDIX hydrolase [Patescibacteria group bacterium]|nr:MAG: NUDIX hydrolase [Patescibacteria group bacterium]
MAIHERPSGYAFIREHDGLILMVQPAWRPIWELPGGGIEQGEDMLAGIHRELMEETGYRAVLSERPIYEAFVRFYDIDGGERRYCHARIRVHAGSLLGPRRDHDPVPAAAVGEIVRIGWLSRQDLTEQNCQRVHWPMLERLR